jgi:hypothetical protein
MIVSAAVRWAVDSNVFAINRAYTIWQVPLVKKFSAYAFPVRLVGWLSHVDWRHDFIDGIATFADNSANS